jgi:hypothetical protein
MVTGLGRGVVVKFWPGQSTANDGNDTNLPTRMVEANGEA